MLSFRLRRFVSRGFFCLPVPPPIHLSGSYEVGLKSLLLCYPMVWHLPLPSSHFGLLASFCLYPFLYLSFRQDTSFFSFVLFLCVFMCVCFSNPSFLEDFLFTCSVLLGSSCFFVGRVTCPWWWW